MGIVCRWEVSHATFGNCANPVLPRLKLRANSPSYPQPCPGLKDPAPTIVALAIWDEPRVVKLDVEPISIRRVDHACGDHFAVKRITLTHAVPR